MKASISKTSMGKAEIGQKKSSLWKMTLHSLKDSKAAMAGFAILCLMILIALFAPLIMPYDYSASDMSNTFTSPSAAHLFGTDDLGRDILSRLIYGTRYSLSLGIISTLIAAIMGTAIGAAAGYYGGRMDNALMRFLDIFQAIPSLLLCIMLAAVAGNGFINTVIAISISSAPGFSRMSRAAILNIRNMEYLEAASSINCGSMRIILKHVLPNALSPLIVQFTMGVANAILFAASLSYIGLGVQPPTPEWGSMLSAGRNYIRRYPYMVISPGICIMFAVFSLNVLGDGLRDALDPKLKK